MKSESERVPEDRLLDVMLSEVLGDQQPPDLSESILAALERSGVGEIERSGVGDFEPSATLLADGVFDVTGPIDVTGPVPPRQVPRVDQPRAVRRSAIQVMRRGGRVSTLTGTRRVWVAAALAASLLGVLGYTSRLWRGNTERPEAVAAGGPGTAAGGPGTAAGGPGTEAGGRGTTLLEPGEEATLEPASPTLGDTNRGPTAGNAGAESAGGVPGDGAGQRQPSRPIELERPEFGEAKPLDSAVAGGSDLPELGGFPEAGRALPDSEVVARINEALERYWAEQGVTPTTPVALATYRSRVADLLGAPLEVDPADPSAALVASLERGEVRRTLADRLAEGMLGRVGRGRLSPDQRSAFADLLAPTFGGGGRYDEVAAELLLAEGATDTSAEDFNAAALWFGALAGPRSVPLVEQFAHVMLDLDLRCARCHDHPLDGRVWQTQYWGLTAIFETGLRWSAGSGDGLKLDSEQARDAEPAPVIFYELADGRQRLARPQLPVPWFLGEGVAAGRVQPAATLSGLTASDDARESGASGAEALRWIAGAMRDNPQLARAAVNRVWEMVYGAPLVGAAINPAAPPESSHTLALQEILAEQLRAHDYDLGRLVAWVAAARPMWASVPEALMSPGFESASPDELRLATRHLRAFAGFPHSLPRQPLGKLLAIASPDLLQRGGLPEDFDRLDGRSMLAQIGGSASDVLKATPANSRRPSDTQLLSASFDTVTAVTDEQGDAGLPTAWLKRVGGDYAFQRRAEHLYFLAGYSHPSGRQLEVARLLRGGVEDDAEALRRLWWVLSHQQ